MGMMKLDICDAWEKRRTYGGFWDCDHYTSGGGEGFTSVTEGSATIAAGDAAFGIVTMSGVDSTNNLEIYLKQTRELFLFAANKPFSIECRIQYTEANTSAMNLAFGVANAVAADLLIDDGGGMRASGSLAAIYKVDGGTVWKTCSQISSTQNISTSTKTAGGSTYQVLRIDVMPVSSTIAEVTYFVDDVQLLLSTGRPGQNLIKDQLTYTGATEMQLFVGMKQGSTSPETVLIDYIAWGHLRGQVGS